jgi:hypothetical protein
MLYQLSYAPVQVLRAGFYPAPARGSSRPLSRVSGVRAPSQRRALGALFLVLALALAGIAVEAGKAAARDQRGLFVIAAAAGALALWLAALAARSLRPR